MHRCREVVIGEQRRGNRGEQCGVETADQGDPDHGKQIDHQVAGEAEVVAERGQQQRQYGQQHHGAGQRGPVPPWARATTRTRKHRHSGPCCLLMGDDVHVDGAGPLDRPLSHTCSQKGGETAAPARTQHDLSDALRLGELEQGIGNPLAPGLVVAAAERLQKGALRVQYSRVDAGEPVLRDHVEGQQFGAGRTSADPRGAADERLALRATAQGHENPFPGLPRNGDAVFGPVALQPLLDPVGEPQQGKFPQCGQVAYPEVVREGGFDAVRWVDVAVHHTAAQHLGRQIDQLDLIGATRHLVGQRLALPDPGDLPDHVIEGFQVLDVERGDNVDADVEELLDVLPPLGIAGPGNIGVGQLVHQRDLRAAGQHRVQIHLGERRTTMGRGTPGNRLQTVGHGRGRPTPVRFDEAHDDIRAQ